MNIRHDLRSGKILLDTPLGLREFDPMADSDRLRLTRLLRIHAEREAGFAAGTGAGHGQDSASAVLAYDLRRVRRFDERGARTLTLEDLED